MNKQIIDDSVKMICDLLSIHYIRFENCDNINISADDSESIELIMKTVLKDQDNF